MQPAFELQFGHGASAVEHCDQRGAATPSMLWMLQFGHGGDAVETARRRPCATTGITASIRPRREAVEHCRNDAAAS